jgi:hypothetical protein
MQKSGIFTPRFLEGLQKLVDHHHFIYPKIPPQGIYFEALVEKAFKQVRQPATRVKPTNRNAPRDDLVVGSIRLSLKTETGLSTDPDFIQITKLLTTEKKPWAADSLINRTLQHLSRYDCILMLRAIWELPVIHYQIVDIPISLLKLIKEAQLIPVGKLTDRQSLGADVYKEGRKVFHVHFDGTDGKCQIRGISVTDCQLLFSWDIQPSD